MIIVLIHWPIKPDCGSDFHGFWSTKATVKNRSGLIGEFLKQSRARWGGNATSVGHLESGFRKFLATRYIMSTSVFGGMSRGLLMRSLSISTIQILFYF